MKKKFLSLALAVGLLATAAIGGTLAYFTDTDAQTNTFTTGNVAIDLWEDFGDNDGLEKLLPATGSAQDGTLKNGIEKEVYVKNTGSEDAYVRVHIAIPQILDDGADTFNAAANVLHFNYAEESVGEGKWDWSKAADDNKYVGDWNYYTTQIGDIWYNVYVVTHTGKLSEGYATVDAISQVYLDAQTTNEDITAIKQVLGDEWKIAVVAEGTQAEGFDNAYDALNTAFGVPGEDYTVDFSNQIAENETWLDTVSSQNK
ncbi:MAG: hypothetical protein IJE29_02825 [Firmicutes bacterium]|nr:hypothetical protein [Bacillota bacterium]